LAFLAAESALTCAGVFLAGVLCALDGVEEASPAFSLLLALRGRASLLAKEVKNR